MQLRKTLVLATLALAAVAATTATATAAPTPNVADANAATFLQFSAWAKANDISATTCKGTGRATRVAGVVRHASFRCTVEVGFKPGSGVIVVAKALGPEWLRVTSVSGGGLAVDKGIGAVPKGTAMIDSGEAGVALGKSAWARANDVEDAFCSGVGPYRDASHIWLFSAFSCATTDAFASRGPQVLVVASSRTAVRVVRKLSK